MSSHEPEVWFAIPSASPERCRRSLPKWREMGYRVAVLQNHTGGAIPADISVWTDVYPGWAQSINILSAKVLPMSAAIVVSGGDDMLPDPTKDAATIAREFYARFPDGLGVMQPMGDDFLGSKTFCGSPWLGRGWIERAYRGQGPMPAWYVHNWADNELYWVSRCLGLLWERNDLTQAHEHFSRLGEQEPAYWTTGVRRHDEHDVKTFLARAWTGFSGHEILGVPRVMDSERFAREYAGQAERYWITRYGLAHSEGEGLKRMRRALDVCAVRGCTKVAIFGAGSHTKSMGSVLMSPPTPVVCIIDDDPRLKGVTLWNYPVVNRETAKAMGVDAVVISSATSEEAMMKAAEPLRAAGALVVRLYDDADHGDGRSAA